jgi:hypothetical protein
VLATGSVEARIDINTAEETFSYLRRFIISLLKRGIPSASFVRLPRALFELPIVLP